MASRIDLSRRAQNMASLEDKLPEKPFEILLHYEQFWAKSTKSPQATSMDRTFLTMATACIILHGNLEYALERIEALEKRQKSMASIVAGLTVAESGD